MTATGILIDRSKRSADERDKADAALTIRRAERLGARKVLEHMQSSLPAPLSHAGIESFLDELLPLPPLKRRRELTVMQGNVAYSLTLGGAPGTVPERVTIASRHTHWVIDGQVLKALVELLQQPDEDAPYFCEAEG